MKKIDTTKKGRKSTKDLPKKSSSKQTRLTVQKKAVMPEKPGNTGYTDI
jgi:hypothetical protein